MTSQQSAEAGVVAAPHFNPSAFSREAAKTLRTVLNDGFYRDSLRLPRPTEQYGLSEPFVFLDYFRKRRNCWGYSAMDGFYRKRLTSEKGRVAVHLFDLFWRAEPVTESDLRQTLGEDYRPFCARPQHIGRVNQVEHRRLMIRVLGQDGDRLPRRAVGGGRLWHGMA